jgi:hypothetical protein
MFMAITANLNPFQSLSYEVTSITSIILKNLSLDLDKVALVCKTWQALVDCQALRDMIRPSRAMGVEELQKKN